MNLLPPYFVLAAEHDAKYYSFSAKELGVIIGGWIDWAHFWELVQEEYENALDRRHVRLGLLEVDRPMREGNELFFNIVHSELFDKAYVAARMNLWWNIEEDRPDLPYTISLWRINLERDTSTKTAQTLIGCLDEWRTFFPDDHRIDDFQNEAMIKLMGMDQ